jgi:periplasmic divalent cation tolerance protein
MRQNVLLTLCTCPDMATATRLAESLVEAALAACVNILPGLTSVYRWEGKIAKDSEVLLMIKTTEQRVAEVVAHIQREHPYDLPEVIAHPIVAGLDSYLEWVRTCTTTKQ